MNRFAAALSTEAATETAIAQVCSEASRQMDGARPSLAVFFVSHDHAAAYAEMGRQIRARTNADALIGAAVQTVVGGAREIEEGPALALWLAHFSDGEVETFQLEVEREDDAVHVHGFPGIEESVDVEKERVSLVLLADPHTFPADLFLRQVNESRPGLKIIGGNASAGSGRGKAALFVDDACIRTGAVGAVLRNVTVRHVVSQGCRPVGRAMVITKAHDNVIEELAGKPALEQLQNVYDEAPEDEKLLLQNAMRDGGFHIGQVIDERQSQPARGDFLVRGVMGFDKAGKAIHIGDIARRGRTVHFHVRDAVSADEDLRDLLDGARARRSAASALLFTCNGRGTNLFETPDHDAASIQKSLGPIPAAGCFANGEIGPVGGRNFLHGFTASVALFDEQ
jgi:small ligand-binding sensory domain FIST